jgi:hypothetical protein
VVGNLDKALTGEVPAGTEVEGLEAGEVAAHVGEGLVEVARAL